MGRGHALISVNPVYGLKVGGQCETNPLAAAAAARCSHAAVSRKASQEFAEPDPDSSVLVLDVVLVATRRIVSPPKKGSAVVRPRSRTLTAVHDGILEDVVYPAEIVGKRVRYHLDGGKMMKIPALLNSATDHMYDIVLQIFLDPKERNNTEYKLDTFSSVYRRLCGKDVVFDYPMTESA
ncbi:hypothetical protein ABZP36_030653 [Zizania latifolia]